MMGLIGAGNNSMDGREIEMIAMEARISINVFLVLAFIYLAFLSYSSVYFLWVP